MLHFFYGKCKRKIPIPWILWWLGILSFPPSLEGVESRWYLQVITKNLYSIKSWMGPYQRTPKEVARAIRFSGLGVRSAGPVGDFLDIHVDSMPFALIPCCCSMPPALKLTHPCPLKIALLKRNWVSQPPLHNIYIYIHMICIYIYVYIYLGKLL